MNQSNAERSYWLASKTLVGKLLSKGHSIAVEKGVVVIKPKQGAELDQRWFADNLEVLVEEITTKFSLSCYYYDSYSTGIFGGKRWEGVSLQFEEINGENDCYAAFNASIRRKRNSKHHKAGELLPGKRFSVGKRSAFYKFWVRSGLKLPPRLTSFHDYMGNLKNTIFVAKVRSSKLVNSTIMPLDLNTIEIANAFISSPDENNNNRKYSSLAYENLDFANGPPCSSNICNSSNAEHRAVQKTKPEEQSNDEWWADYYAAKSL